MNTNIDWRFCAVGNIKTQHTDENGKILYGTKAFSGGTKVYIDDKTQGSNDGCVSVIGLNRFGRYAVECIPLNLIENVRLQRIYKPTVLKIMDHLEYQMAGYGEVEQQQIEKKSQHLLKCATAFNYVTNYSINLNMSNRYKNL